MKRNFLALYPSYIDNNGHENDYIDTLRDIAKKYNLSLIIFAPKKNIIKKNIKIFKVYESYKRSIINSFIYIIKNFQNTNFFIKKNSSENICFVDTQILPFYIYLYMFITKIKISYLILVLRGSPNFFKFYFYNFFLHIIKKKKIKVKIFVDNLEIKKYLIKKYQIKTDTISMPHLIHKKKIKKKSNEKINLLFPGTYRKSKYGKNFDEFVKYYNDKNTILNISENTNLIQKPNIFKVKYFKDNLEKKKYDYLFSLCDVILLPYDNKTYKYMSSGIFVESIKMRKTVFVTSETLMSKDLKKAKLDDLIVSDWTQLDAKKIVTILKSKIIKKLLAKLSIKYNLQYSKKKIVGQLSFLKN
jgi:hypothetical protein